MTPTTQLAAPAGVGPSATNFCPQDESFTDSGGRHLDRQSSALDARRNVDPTSSTEDLLQTRGPCEDHMINKQAALEDYARKDALQEEQDEVFFWKQIIKGRLESAVRKNHRKFLEFQDRVLQQAAEIEGKNANAHAAAQNSGQAKNDRGMGPPQAPTPAAPTSTTTSSGSNWLNKMQRARRAAVPLRPPTYLDESDLEIPLRFSRLAKASSFAPEWKSGLASGVYDRVEGAVDNDHESDRTSERVEVQQNMPDIREVDPDSTSIGEPTRPVTTPPPLHQHSEAAKPPEFLHLPANAKFQLRHPISTTEPGNLVPEVSQEFLDFAAIVPDAFAGSSCCGVAGGGADLNLLQGGGCTTGANRPATSVSSRRQSGLVRPHQAGSADHLQASAGSCISTSSSHRTTASGRSRRLSIGGNAVNQASSRDRGRPRPSALLLEEDREEARREQLSTFGSSGEAAMNLVEDATTSAGDGNRIASTSEPQRGARAAGDARGATRKLQDQTPSAGGALTNTCPRPNVPFFKDGATPADDTTQVEQRTSSALSPFRTTAEFFFWRPEKSKANVLLEVQRSVEEILVKEGYTLPPKVGLLGNGTGTNKEQSDLRNCSEGDVTDFSLSVPNFQKQQHLQMTLEDLDEACTLSPPTNSSSEQHARKNRNFHLAGPPAVGSSRMDSQEPSPEEVKNATFRTSVHHRRQQGDDHIPTSGVEDEIDLRNAALKRFQEDQVSLRLAERKRMERLAAGASSSGSSEGTRRAGVSTTVDETSSATQTRNQQLPMTWLVYVIPWRWGQKGNVLHKYWWPEETGILMVPVVTSTLLGDRRSSSPAVSSQHVGTAAVPSIRRRAVFFVRNKSSGVALSPPNSGTSATDEMQNNRQGAGIMTSSNKLSTAFTITNFFELKRRMMDADLRLEAVLYRQKLLTACQQQLTKDLQVRRSTIRDLQVRRRTLRPELASWAKPPPHSPGGTTGSMGGGGGGGGAGTSGRDESRGLLGQLPTPGAAGSSADVPASLEVSHDDQHPGGDPASAGTGAEAEQLAKSIAEQTRLLREGERQREMIAQDLLDVKFAANLAKHENTDLQQELMRKQIVQLREEHEQRLAEEQKKFYDLLLFGLVCMFCCLIIAFGLAVCFTRLCAKKRKNSIVHRRSTLASRGGRTSTSSSSSGVARVSDSSSEEDE
ncbi:unnamed protein product [Amoebophrya sp. A120]|nr:unnamed protein product [Amoebophrya sp. A120]|eukprot:GSA120T00008110001.1